MALYVYIISKHNSDCLFFILPAATQIRPLTKPNLAGIIQIVFKCEGVSLTHPIQTCFHLGHPWFSLSRRQNVLWLSCYQSMCAFHRVYKDISLCSQFGMLSSVYSTKHCKRWVFCAACVRIFLFARALLCQCVCACTFVRIFVCLSVRYNYHR